MEEIFYRFFFCNDLLLHFITTFLLLLLQKCVRLKWKRREAVKTYNVREIAKLLNTNPETVRRWIRTGKLKSDIDSRKGGNVVTEQMLSAFLKSSPKYANIAATSLATPIGLGVVTATLLGGMLADKYIKDEKIKNAQVDTQEVIRLLEEDINNRTKAIKRKQTTIDQLQAEIDEEYRRVEDTKKLIADLSGKKVGFSEE